jgi:hypothetical protein
MFLAVGWGPVSGERGRALLNIYPAWFPRDGQGDSRYEICASTWVCGRLAATASGIAPVFNAKNPLSLMDPRDVQEMTNFFKRRVSSYQSAVAGEVAFYEDFRRDAASANAGAGAPLVPRRQRAVED